MRYVYFLQEPSAGHIKIGSTWNINKRIAQLEVGLPYKLKLIGLLEGECQTEKDIQKKFADYCVKGEWFRPEAQLLEFIAQHAKFSETPLNLEEAVKAMEGKPTTVAGQECKELLVELEDLDKLLTPKKATYNIEKAAQLLGISAQTLRNWDKSGRMKADRTEGKHRRYTESQIRELRRQMMTGSEFFIEGIAKETLISGLETLLILFEPKDKISFSVQHNALFDEVTITVSSEDGLTTTKKTFKVKE